jgi:DUF2075 family protein
LASLFESAKHARREDRIEYRWIGQRDQSHDRVVRRGVTEAEFTRYVKSTYRVLLTRGLRGCYVYFMDAPTRDFFLSRTERAIAIGTAAAAETPAPYGSEGQP